MYYCSAAVVLGDRVASTHRYSNVCWGEAVWAFCLCCVRTDATVLLLLLRLPCTATLNGFRKAHREVRLFLQWYWHMRERDTCVQEKLKEAFDRSARVGNVGGNNILQVVLVVMMLSCPSLSFRTMSW